jgi:peptidoglycan/LPS O-acetylase OafA/YrhL
VFAAAGFVYSYFYVTQMPSGVIKGVLLLIRSIASVGGIFTVFALSRLIRRCALSAPLKELGQYSYDIYLIHAPFLVSGSMGLLLKLTPLPSALCCIIVLIIGILIPYLLSRFVIRKVPPLSFFILGRYNFAKK